MSLSSLEAQLAAMQQQGGGGSGTAGQGQPHAGSYLPTNKRHEEAIGRGLAHSVQTGYSATATKQQVASILYPTAAAASDVPMHVCREQCSVAWHELTTAIPAPEVCRQWMTLLESQDPAPAAKKQRKIFATLTVYISSCLAGEGGSNTSSSRLQSEHCLSVLEYLIRRHSIHASTTMLNDFLWIFLPHSHTLPTIWHHALQLVDLAGSTSQSYLWLRPYAAASGGTTVPPLQLVARHVVQDLSLLRALCQWTSSVAALHTNNSNSKNDHEDTATTAFPRQGIARLLSYSAAVLVQGLSWLTTVTDDSKLSNLWPAVVRSLLPTLLSACGCNASSNTDWTSWGYVVASVLAETCPLAPQTVQVLVAQTLKGAISVSETDTDVAAVADSVAAALSILLPPHVTMVLPKKQQQQQETYLVLTNGKWVGCPLLWTDPNSDDDSKNDRIWQALEDLDAETFGAAVGHLHADRNVYVAPLVAAVCLAALQKQSLPLATALLEEAALQTLYEDPRIDLVASIATRIVQMVLKEEEDQMVLEETEETDESFLDTARAMLQVLHTIDSAACERGMADAMQRNPLNNSQKERLTLLLEGIVAPATIESGDTAVDQLLPPRVALEHADASVRLQAVKRLVSSEMEDANGGGDFESLMESLLRRWSMEDDAQVALAASTAVCDAWSTVDVVTEANYRRLAELTLSGAYRWIQNSAETAELSGKSLMLTALVAKEVGQVSREGSTTLWQLLIEVIAAQLDHEISAKSAAEAVLVAWGVPKKKDILSTAKKSLAGSEILTKGIQQFYTQVKGIDKRAELAIRQRCLWVLVESIANNFDERKNSEQDAIAFCLLVLSAKDTSRLDDDNCELLKKCLNQSTAKMSERGTEIPIVLSSLASVTSDVAFNKVALPVIRQLSASVRIQGGASVSALTVLMEVALRVDTPSVAIERLLSLASELVSSVKGTAVWLGVVPALALLESADDGVRVASVTLLENIEKALGTQAKSDYKPLVEICQGISKNKSSATLGGSAFLSNVLTDCISASQDAETLRDVIMKLCVISATSANGDTKKSTKSVDRSWLELSQAYGGCQAASILLNAIDFAGEESFPLHSRWKVAGQPLVEIILKANPSEGEVSAPLQSLMETVVIMLKGVTISDPQIIISSGPRSGGGRARSYSVGKVEGVRVIDPYPKEMYNTIIDVLTLKDDTSGTRTFAALIARDVLSSKSWGDGIYKNLSRPVRKRVASAILSYFSGDVADPPDGVFVALPFDSIDVSELLAHGETDARDLASVSILTDFIRSNIDRMQSSTGLNGLVSRLFDLLATLSSEKSDDLDGLDFTCQSILQALRQIWDGVNGTTTEIKIEKKRLDDLISLLLALFGRSDDGKFQSVRPLPTHRSRCTALSLLASLCQMYPGRVVGSLIPAMLTCISAFDGPDSAAMNMSDAFAILVPVYCLHAPSAGLSLATLLSSFVGAVRILPDEPIRASAFQAMAHALGVQQETAAGALVAAFLASEVFAKGNQIKTGESVLSAVQVLSSCPASMQTASLLLLLRYAKSCLLELQGEAGETEIETGFLPTHNDIAMIAVSGSSAVSKKHGSPFHKSSREAVIVLAQSILKTFSETLLLDSIRRFVRKSEGTASSLCLQLWQGLLVLQSTAQSMTNDETGNDEAFWKSAADTVNESREYLQELLPAHIFLASVTSLIKEGETDEIRARALRLVADRVADVDPHSPEAALFIDLIPDIVNLLEPVSAEMSEEYESRGIVLQQSALIAIEHIARVMGFSRQRGGRSTAATYFFKALERSGALLLGHSRRVKDSASDFSSLDNSLCQLFCSIALCAATLVRATGARCLPVLPKMMGIFIELLSSTNGYVCSSPVESESLSQARVIQLSLLRFFLAVAESVPQFLGSYLDSLLVELAVLSKCLSIVPKEQSDVFSLKSAAAHLEGVLPSRIPSRLFLPAASRAVAKCSTPAEACTMLSMMKVSVDESTPAEVSAQKNIILQSVTKAYDYEGSFSERSILLETANNVLVTLVLKLSELQLRGLYQSLREWRGEFDKTNPEKLAKRRYAFWTVSAALSKELRSIFLPCFSMVISDVVGELELAASSLCQPKLAEKSAGGNKKRRLTGSDEDAGYGVESLRTLEPLLRCLEHCLRADALDGGNWVRSDENQRYNSLLEPLGKLLQSRVPPDTHTDEGTVSDPFQRIVHGAVEDGGSVVSCLTALAAAAGNEQLWKPLNHSVLDACGNESRSEVRQAGIACLLSLMKSLGEEYMVLLPECLPVLSELLEDSDETIASLAKETVTLAEELIGESLEDSLR
jgi:hypothetical protein